jgi:anti-sigma factor RsiW
VSSPSAVSEADLQAYVDGRLSAERRAAVEAWLEAHPDDASRVAAYRVLGEQCRAMYAPVLAEPVPAELLSARKRERSAGRRLATVAALAATLAVAALGVWQIGQELPLGQKTLEIAERASVAHALYAAEPSQVFAAHGDKAKILAWLSSRLAMRVEAPDLDAIGLVFVGGELVPGGTAPAAVLLYKRTDGAHVTFFWAPEFRQARESGVRYGGSARGARVYYWLDDECGYAIASAELGQKELLSVALMAYGQLER